MRALSCLFVLTSCGGEPPAAPECATDMDCGVDRCVEGACVPCGSECAPPPPDPTLALDVGFEVLDGVLVRDRTAHDHDAVLEGGARLTPEGKLGSALWLDGDPMSRASFGDVLPLSTGLTIELYVKLAPDQPSYPTLVSRWDDGSGYWLGGTATSTAFAFWTGWTEIRGGRLFPDAWFHVAATWDPTTRSSALYVDGARVASQTMDDDPGVGPPSFTIGRSVSDNTPIAAIDELKVWSRARTPAEICADAGFVFAEGACR